MESVMGWTCTTVRYKKWIWHFCHQNWRKTYIDGRKVSKHIL